MGNDDVSMDVELWRAAESRSFGCCGWAFGVGWGHGRAGKRRVVWVNGSEGEWGANVREKVGRLGDQRG